MAQRLDSAGNVLSSSAYDAYGAESSTTTPTDPFGYHAQDGYYMDRESGLYLCQSRYYDPGTGRWATRDPIGYGGGINLYGYCAGGPVGNADPEGTSVLLMGLLGGRGGGVPNLGGWSDSPPLPSAPSAPEFMPEERGSIPLVPMCWPLLAAGLIYFSDPGGLGSTPSSTDGGGGGAYGAGSNPYPAGLPDWASTVSNSKGGNDKGRGDDPAWTMDIDKLKALMDEELAAGNFARYRALLKIYKQRRKKPRDGSQG